MAPRDTWHIRGGCVSRSAASATLPAEDELVADWHREFDGPIEGEPLVWDNWVVVCVHKGDKRYLHSLDLRTGKRMRSTLSFKTSQPLAPSIWNRVIAIRTAPNTIATYRVTRSALTRISAYKSKTGNVSEPLLFRDELYFVDRTSVRRMSTRCKPVWTSQDSGYLGELSLFDNVLFAAQDKGQPLLTQLSRRSGFPKAMRLPKGQRSHANRIETMAGRVFRYVRHGWKDNLLCGTSTLGGRRLASPALLGDRLVLFTNLPNSGDTLALLDTNKGQVRILGLANRDFHRKLTEDPGPLSIAGDVVYHPRFAFGIDDRMVRWRLDNQSDERVIPARNSVLLTKGQRLERWRNRLVMGTGEALAVDATTLPGRAFFADGSVWEGKFEVLDGAVKRRKDTVPLDDVLLLTSAEDAPLRWPAPSRMKAALDAVAAQFRRETMKKIAQRVGVSNDTELIERTIALARTADVEDKVVQAAEKKLAAVRRRKGVRVQKKVQTEVRNRLTHIDANLHDHLWSLVERTPDDAPTESLHALWRAMLDYVPDHPGICKKIRAKVPKSMPAPEPFEPKAWLDFIEACAQVEFELVQPDAKGTPAQSEIALHCEKWRPDLFGVQTENLLVITPPGQPGAVARCLSAGELGCSALESMFPEKHEGVLPLRIILFESREAYHKHSPAAKAGHDIDWTAGHYSPSERISRMFIPSDDSEFRRVRGTFVHELTHHWLDERGPGFGKNSLRQMRGGLRGFWIVEGFASFVEEFVFDDYRRTWETRNPRSSELDLIRNSTARHRLPWKGLLGASQVTINGNLDTKPTMPIGRTFQLGQYAMVSPMTMFYAQSTAACRYLFHAEDGKYREKLVGYVRAFYEGKGELDVEKAFGADAETLGERIVEYAGNVIR